MKAFTTMVVLAALPFAALAADEAKLSCGKDVLYSQEFLQQYPKAPAGCQEVVSKDGAKWVRFNAEVTGVKDGRVSMDIKNVAGDAIGAVQVESTGDARVKMEGKDVKFTSLRQGDEVDIWVPEARYGFYSAPGAGTNSQLKVVGGMTSEKH
jgi:phage gp45-like